MSIARFYGGIQYNGHKYLIAENEEGQPLVREDVLKRERKGEMKDILSMANKSAPERVSKPGAVLYSSSGFLAKPPEKFTRNEKLAYIEHKFSTEGYAADSDKFVMEIRLSRLSFESFKAARAYGLHVFAAQSTQQEGE
jgi:hypothetical protein